MALPSPSCCRRHTVFVRSALTILTIAVSQTQVTAHEGARVRRAKCTTFTSSRDKEYTENCCVWVTNQGEVSILSVPDLRRQVNVCQLAHAQR